MQGDYKKRSDKLSTHNGRLESIQTSKLYSPSLQKRRRCIVICEGFYEWKAGANNKSPKQPYYIYVAQDKGIKADDPATWTNEFSETDGWKGLNVLKLAGIFGAFTTDEVDKLLALTIQFYCFKIINIYLVSQSNIVLREKLYIAAQLSQERATKFCLGCTIACRCI